MEEKKERAPLTKLEKKVRKKFGAAAVLEPFSTKGQYYDAGLRQLGPRISTVGRTPRKWQGEPHRNSSKAKQLRKARYGNQTYEEHMAFLKENYPWRYVKIKRQREEANQRSAIARNPEYKLRGLKRRKVSIPKIKFQEEG